MKKELNLIKKTVQILDSVSYADYSDGKAHNYPTYMKGARRDEDNLIAPVLFHKFAEQVLGFKMGESLWRWEPQTAERGKPDFTPVDTRTHPFVFELKGTDTDDLSKYYKEKRKYLKTINARFLILTNMRDLDAYTEERAEEVDEYNFNFLQLHKDYKENPKLALDKQNTRKFLRFVERFSFRELTVQDKITRIAEGKPWTGLEELNPDLLTTRLRSIVNILHEDARSKRNEIADFLESDPNRAKNIAQEIENIASEISPGREMTEVDEDALAEVLDAGEKTIYGRSLDSFLYRVAYFTMTRLLLARAWEDIDFIDQSLYDGGFKKWYDNFNKEIRRVLTYAFGLAADRYPWLFNVHNNYSWYEPSNCALMEALYELSNFNLAGLNQDVLGVIYEEYIDKVDKKKKGQYYTPREIVGLIWDRVGYTNPKAFFWHIREQADGKTVVKRVPRLIFDPATGSGGFLVEAARRLREESGLDTSDFQNLFELYRGILYYIFGAEISVFPYYITEVNLLIQLTPIVKQMMTLKRAFKERTPLGVVCVDALSLFNPPKKSLFPGEGEEIQRSKALDLLPLDNQKKAVFEKIREKFDEKFSYCCANPPYVGEKGHKELFRDTVSRFPYWKDYYQGKMDYLYWFIILGLSKLREWGKLGFITSAYWPTADGASKLRGYILENAKIKEMILFEDVKIFEYAKGQHNMVFILEKCSGKNRAQERSKNRIKIVRVLAKHQEIPGDTIREKLRSLTQHIRKHIGKEKWQDKYIEVFWSAVKQGELPKNGGVWNLTYADSANRVLRTMQKVGEPLQILCKISVGVLTAADKVTKRNIKWLTEEDIKKSNIKIDDGIFVLNQSEYQGLNYAGKNVKSFFKNSDIDPYVISPDKQHFLIYATENIKNDPICMRHLSKFESLLKQSKKVRGEEHIPWYELVRKKSPELFDGPKIVTPNRAAKNTFGYSEAPYYGVSDIFVIVTKKETRESPKYILGLLNSAPLNFWTSNRNKRKGNALEFVGSPLSQIPIRRINFENLEEVKMHDEIVEKVDTIRGNMAQLTKYSEYFEGPRLTRLKFDEPLPQIDAEAVIKTLSAEKIYSLRTHPNIEIEKSKDVEDSGFYLRRIGKVESTLYQKAQLTLKAKAKSTINLIGPHELLDLTAIVLGDWKGELWAEIKEKVLLPESVSLYESNKEGIVTSVKTLRSEIAKIQNEIDQIVNTLYGIEEAR